MPLVHKAKLVIDDPEAAISPTTVLAEVIYREGKLDEIVLDPSQLKERFRRVV